MTTSYEAEILEAVKTKNLQPGDKVEWDFKFPGWKEQTYVKLEGRFNKLRLIMDGGMVKPFRPKHLKSAVGLIVVVNETNYPTRLRNIFYYFDGCGIMYQQEEFKTLMKQN